MLDQASIDRLRGAAVPAQRHFVAGDWADSADGATLEVTSPIDGSHLTTLADGGAQDVDRAVVAARAAYEGGTWSRAAPAARKKVLLKLAELIEDRALDLAVLGVRDNGTEIGMALKGEPLSAAGNSVVLKPAEVASLTLLRLAELAAEAGLPEGVFNVVTGQGAVTGEALGLHMGVDALAFTGSGAVGRRLLEYAARSNLKRVWLELGGKSPNVVFADAPDVDCAAQVSAFGIFRNSGQVCVAGSRLLVEDAVYDEFLEKLVAAAARLRVGDPLDLKSDVGAVSSAAQLAKDLDHVATAEREGARRLTGGNRLLEDTGGFYMAPTVFDAVTPEMTLAREEVFGPVLAVMRFSGWQEAARLANDSVYGLAAAVWTGSLDTAHRMIRAIEAGTVYVNTYGGADITTPLGGFKQSGFGRDKSLHAFDKYTDLKTAWIALG